MLVRDPETEQAVALAGLLRGRPWVALTGAGMSTDSGIPDYRGPTSVRATPMQFSEFVGSAEARQRYWARSYLGFRRIGEAAPNHGHRLLSELEAYGLAGVVTQNVDGLHSRAGSREVINLHGEIAAVVCLACGQQSTRAELQRRLRELNPEVRSLADPARADPVQAPSLAEEGLRPDGDMVSAEWQTFRLADCRRCAGPLKPDLVFFGESVPKPRVQAAYAMVDRGDVLVVLGSSLTVMSGLRFVRHCARLGRPTVIVNRGVTRGDDLASVKIDGGCAETLAALRAALD